MPLSINIRHKDISTNKYPYMAYEEGIDDPCSPDGNSFLIQATQCMHRIEIPLNCANPSSSCELLICPRGPTFAEILYKISKSVLISVISKLQKSNNYGVILDYSA